MAVSPTPRRGMKSDADIKRDTLAELSWDTRISIEDIGVTVDDGVVTLSGTADTYLERWAAVDAAFSVGGVVDVIDNITVMPPHPLRPDEEVAGDVSRALSWDARIDEADVDVLVDNGTVTLSGTVGSLFEMDSAVEDASWTNGVVDVVNNLIVRPPEPRTDEEVKRDIEDAMKRDALVNAERIRVNVTDGTVILTGTADSFAEKTASEADARLTRGVTAVINNIAVSPA